MLFFLVLVIVLVHDNIFNTKLVYGHRETLTDKKPRTCGYTVGMGRKSTVISWARTGRLSRQVAQLSQTDHAVGWVSLDQK